MRLIHVGVLMLAAALAAAGRGAGIPAQPSTSGPTARAAVGDSVLSPMVKSAMQGLSAEDFPAREKALADLELALGQQMRALTQVSDPEAQARINDLLTFEEGLCAWARDVLRLPADKQQEVFAFGLQAEVLPQVAHLYAKDAALRMDAVRALRRNPDPRVMDLLARALDDPEQQVYVAAMEAVYDRPPTDAVIDRLWNRSVAAQFATFHPQPQPAPDRITFLGKPIQAINNGDNDLYLRTQDNALATDVLVHLKPPQVESRIRALFAEAEAVYARGNNANGNNDQNIWMYLPSQDAMRNAIRIAGALKDMELVPGLYRMATGPVLQRSQGQLGRQTYFWSNRTWAIALLLQFTDQSPADWNLQTMTQLQGMWAVPTELDERAAVVKLKAWWGKEHAKYGGAADTRPAVPEDPPLPPQPVLRKGPIILN